MGASQVWVMAEAGSVRRTEGRAYALDAVGTAAAEDLAAGMATAAGLAVDSAATAGLAGVPFARGAFGDCLTDNASPGALTGADVSAAPAGTGLTADGVAAFVTGLAGSVCVSNGLATGTVATVTGELDGVGAGFTAVVDGAVAGTAA